MIKANNIDKINENVEKFLGKGSGTFTTSSMDKPLTWWLDIIADEKLPQYKTMTDMEILKEIVFN